MDKHTIPTLKTRAALTATLNRFSGFAARVIRDADFLRSARRLPPLDGLTHAAMTPGPPGQPVRTMGLALMRMDIEPPLFSLAVTVNPGAPRDSSPGERIVFLAACKTLEQLQDYVGTPGFRESVRKHCTPAPSPHALRLKQLAAQANRKNKKRPARPR